MTTAPDQISSGTAPVKWTRDDRRNHFGVKNSADMYRTFEGEPYPQFCSDPGDDLITALRRGLVRCRRIGEELYVRLSDQDRATVIHDQIQAQARGKV